MFCQLLIKKPLEEGPKAKGHTFSCIRLTLSQWPCIEKSTKIKFTKPNFLMWINRMQKMFSQYLNEVSVKVCSRF
jgi:hypothetical protein